jgi:predicted esterase
MRLFTILLVLALPALARAQKLDTAPLRARLAALEQKPPEGLSRGVLLSIGHVLDVYERIRDSFPQDAPEWFARADRYLDAAEQGKDGIAAENGRIVSRGYRSPISQRIQGYTVYVPPNYTPDRAWPLMIVLHGGSSNGNLFLGVVLGNNMSWLEYDKHLWHRYEPKWSPEWIVAAPDGYGQVLWRWMGEQDVLDVVTDIQQHYRVDANRVVLGGLSNGGVGAYSIGSRHAWRYALVQAMAGAPSWTFYSGESSVVEPELTLMKALNAFDLAENWHGTEFRYYHGTVDPGPMRPAYVHRLDEQVQKLGVPHKSKWFETGHDLLYLVHRHGKIYDELAAVKRNSRPTEVHVVSGDYRAARQHWLEITRFRDYPQLANLVGKASGARVEVSTRNVEAFAIDLRSLPGEGEGALELAIDGESPLKLERSQLGHRLHLVKRERWLPGVPSEQGLAKKPGLSGPVSDAYHGRMVHVFGTQNAEHAAELEKLAKKGARGWPMWLWTVDQEVVADRDVTEAMMRDAHLVLYGTPGDNAVLDRIAARLPIRVEGDAIVAGTRRFTGKGVGTKFVYPNPEAPDHYVIPMMAPTVDGVRRAHNLPDFVPDYVVFDAASTGARPRLVPAKSPLARGFFDARWQLPAAPPAP